MKVTVTRSKKEIEQNSGTVKISNLTTGEMMSLYNALVKHSQVSPVANDVLSFLTVELKQHWEKVVELGIPQEIKEVNPLSLF